MMFNSSDGMSTYISQEKERAQQFFTQDGINKIFQDYLNEASQRKDKRSKDLPEQYGDYLYTSTYGVFNSGNDYQIIERTHIDTKKEEVVLDISKFTQFLRYQATLQLTKTQLSDDHNLIAFGIDLNNDERTIWMVKKIDEITPRTYREQLKGCVNAKFTKCGTHLIYVEMDDKYRTSSIKLHKLGTQQEYDDIIFEEEDESFYLDIQETKDKKYYIIVSGSKVLNKIYVMHRDTIIQKNKIPKIMCIVSQEMGCLAYCSHANGKFYVLTNNGVHDFKVQTVEDHTLENGQPIFKDFYYPEQGEIISELDLFDDKLVLYIRCVSDSYIKVIPLNDNMEQKYIIKIPISIIYQGNDNNKQGLINKIYKKYISRKSVDEYLKKSIQNEIVCASITPGLNENYKLDKLRFHLDTPLIYNQVYEFQFNNKQLIKLQDSFLTGKLFNREQYVCIRLDAPSVDGTSIPITLVHHKDIKLNRQNKLILHSYGAYGIPQDIPFSVVYLSALERGWVLAYAHIRGGNEMGHKWHSDAIKMNKINSIDDLISCAAHLIAKGYTHPTLLCGIGGSAGATILAAAVNMRPDLWKCVIYTSPFLDILGNLLDKTLPLTVTDFEEFGNPIDDQDCFEYIKSYSPYDNIQDQAYPVKLIVAGQNDYRAPLWGVIKYAQRFRQKTLKSEKIDNQFIQQGLIVDIMESGHYGKAGVQAGIEERCKQMAFLEYFVGDGNKEATVKNLTEAIDSGLAIEEFDPFQNKKNKI